MAKKYFLVYLFAIFVGFSSSSVIFDERVYAAEMEVILEDSSSATGFSVKDGNGNTLMRVLGVGNVGIGNTAPTEKLDVAGTVKATAFVGDGSGLTGFIGGGGLGNSLNAADGDPVNALFVDDSGNVGIGTTVPGAKLHIGGTPGTDGIMFPDGTLQTTAGVAAFISSTNSFDMDNDVKYTLCTDPSTGNYKYTPQVAGVYNVFLYGGFSWNGDDPEYAGTDTYLSLSILKNGVNILDSQGDWENLAVRRSVHATSHASRIVYLNGNTDYINFAATQHNEEGKKRRWASSGTMRSGCGAFLVAPNYGGFMLSGGE